MSSASRRSDADADGSAKGDCPDTMRATKNVWKEEERRESQSQQWITSCSTQYHALSSRTAATFYFMDRKVSASQHSSFFSVAILDCRERADPKKTDAGRTIQNYCS